MKAEYEERGGGWGGEGGKDCNHILSSLMNPNMWGGGGKKNVSDFKSLKIIPEEFVKQA